MTFHKQKMFPSVNYVWNRPDGVLNRRPPIDLSISPDGQAASPEADGDINLFEQASKIFGQLGAANVFTAQANTFQDIFVRRLHVTSDRSTKTEVAVVVEEEATALVRRMIPRRYKVDGESAAGMIADELPTQYVRSVPGLSTLSVDYNSLMAEMWASLKHAHMRIDALDGTIFTPDPSGPPAAASSTDSWTQT